MTLREVIDSTLDYQTLCIAVGKFESCFFKKSLIEKSSKLLDCEVEKIWTEYSNEKTVLHVKVDCDDLNKIKYIFKDYVFED